MNRSRYVPVLLTAVLVSACLGAFAYASTNNNSSNVIYACANRTNGQMRLASGPQDCKQHETALSWNQIGPQGPGGPQGPPASLTGDFRVFTQTGGFTDLSGEATLSARCDDPGWAVIGWIPPQASSPDVQFHSVNTNLDGTSATWLFDATGAENVQVTVGVLCMRLPDPD